MTNASSRNEMTDAAYAPLPRSAMISSSVVTTETQSSFGNEASRQNKIARHPAPPAPRTSERKLSPIIMTLSGLHVKNLNRR